MNGNMSGKLFLLSEAQSSAVLFVTRAFRGLSLSLEKLQAPCTLRSHVLEFSQTKSCPVALLRIFSGHFKFTISLAQ